MTKQLKELKQILHIDVLLNELLYHIYINCGPEKTKEILNTIKNDYKQN